MYYKKMSEEYFSEAEILKKYILRLKENCADEFDLRNPEIYQRISTLYEMYLNLKYMGNFLQLKSKFER